jgi:peptidoglycan/LPS O-acetylase OafA/YrhL
LVVWGHIGSLFFASNPKTALSPLHKLLALSFAQGSTSVMVFFVLSGFFISSSIFRGMSSGKFRWSDYVNARLTRLYVALIPALIFGACWDLLGSHLFGLNTVYGGLLTNAVSPEGVTEQLGARDLLTNLSFLQTIHGNIWGSNGPLWSLAYEFWYYVLFPLGAFAIARKTPLAARGLYIVLFAAVVYLVHGATVDLFPIWLLGSLTAIAEAPKFTTTRVFRIFGWVCLIGSILAKAFTTKLDAHHFDNYAMGVSFAMVLVGILNCPNRQPSEWYAKFASGTASFSYTLYLVHYPFLMFMSAWLVGSGPIFGADPKHLLIAVGLLLAATLYAVMVWLIGEKHTDKLREAIQKRLTPSPKAQPAAS